MTATALLIGPRSKKRGRNPLGDPRDRRLKASVQEHARALFDEAVWNQLSEGIRFVQGEFDDEGVDEQPEPYAPGSWGPASADELLARDGRTWRRP